MEGRTATGVVDEDVLDEALGEDAPTSTLDEALGGRTHSDECASLGTSAAAGVSTTSRSLWSTSLE